MTGEAKGVVAAGHRLTADAAAEVLRAGGTACDAAIAAGWMACVCEPVLASPGGGGFAMVGNGTETSLLDFFAHTPLSERAKGAEYYAADADFGTARQTFHIGHGATATPGHVPGLYALHDAHGSVPMADLVAPAARAARDGVTVTPFQHFLSTVVAPILLASPGSRQLFGPGGDLVPVGDVFRNPGLADLLDLIARQGMPAYDGTLRAEMLAGQQAAGHLIEADFTGYRPEWRKPLELQLEGLDIFLNPAPSAGGTLIAHTLSGVQDLSPQELARALDATDRKRREVGGDLAAILASFGLFVQRGTTHISVIGSQGDACSMTLSNGEGNGHIVGDFGFMLNNMLGEEDVNPAGASGWPTDRRLSSIMCPTIARRDGTIFALGSGGSNRIRSTIARVLTLLAGQSGKIADIIAAPRMHVESGHLDVEAQFPPAVIADLQTAFPDHRLWREPNLFFGGCHIAARTSRGDFSGAGDTRREGAAIIA